MNDIYIPHVYLLVCDVQIVYEVDESSLEINMIASHYLSAVDDSFQSIAVHPKVRNITATFQIEAG
jgi:hypothetical protein